MRTLLIAGLVGVASAAGAQERVVVRGPGASYPPPGQTVAVPHAPPSPIATTGSGRWGPRVGGRWSGGVQAPGGYAAYRQPLRGQILPSYWTSPRFYVFDWASSGLPQPPVGYNWVRYYDDAVLVDGHGSVYDTQVGVDWDRFDRGGSYADAPI